MQVRYYREVQPTKVSILHNDRLIRQFYSIGNDQKTKSYFKAVPEGKIYEVHIPGYNVYIAGMFEPAKPNQQQ